VDLWTGGNLVCAKAVDGRIKCWGQNADGRLGLGDTANRGDQPNEMGSNLPVLDLGLGGTVVELSVGGAHACALLDNGSLKCWGRNDKGQLGLGDVASRGDNPGEMGDNLPAINVGTGRTIAHVSAGTDHTCVVFVDGDVKCWGSNFYGELGLVGGHRGDGPGEMGDNLPLVNLGTGKTAVAIAASYYATCALLTDGTVKCWGGNFYGRLGLGDTMDRGLSASTMGNNLPAVALGTGKTATAIQTSSSGFHTCTVLNDQSVKCWGIGGLLGLGDTNNRGDNPGEMGDSLPAVNLGTGKTAVKLSVSYDSTCVKLNDGSLKCWGNNSFGQLGVGDMIKRGDDPGEMGDNLPVVNLGTGKTATAFAAGVQHACAILNDGSVKCWGYNGYGQLGLGNTTWYGNNSSTIGDNLPVVNIF